MKFELQKKLSFWESEFEYPRAGSKPTQAKEELQLHIFSNFPCETKKPQATYICYFNSLLGQNDSNWCENHSKYQKKKILMVHVYFKQNEDILNKVHVIHD